MAEATGADMRFGSLFSGIGGMDLGLERAGMTCAWQCEIDDYARRVLAKHWPNVRRHDDVRTFPPGDADEWHVDLIAGGLPCQDISNAGPRVGITGERSGLWSEYARVVRLLRPRFVFVENVPEITLPGRGLDVVLGDLASMGFDAEWACMQAAAFGAPHPRERFWLVAYPEGGSRSGIKGRNASERTAEKRPSRPHRNGSNANGFDEQARIFRAGREIAALPFACWGTDKPGVDRASYGISHRVERLRGLGNAVVPQVSEWIGRRIMEAAS